MQIKLCPPAHLIRTVCLPAQLFLLFLLVWSLSLKAPVLLTVMVMVDTFLLKFCPLKHPSILRPPKLKPILPSSGPQKADYLSPWESQKPAVLRKWTVMALLFQSDILPWWSGGLLSNARDAGLIPGWGAKIPHAVEQLSPSAQPLSPCATTGEKPACRKGRVHGENPVCYNQPNKWINASKNKFHLDVQNDRVP